MTQPAGLATVGKVTLSCGKEANVNHSGYETMCDQGLLTQFCPVQLEVLVAKNVGHAPKALSMLRAPRGGKKERREKKKGEVPPM